MQAFSAGVGNWVADEVLYQARVHPEQKASTLSEEQAGALHEQLQGVLQARPSRQYASTAHAMDSTCTSLQCRRKWLRFRVHARRTRAACTAMPYRESEAPRKP